MPYMCSFISFIIIRSTPVLHPFQFFMRSSPVFMLHHDFNRLLFIFSSFTHAVHTFISNSIFILNIIIYLCSFSVPHSYRCNRNIHKERWSLLFYEVALGVIPRRGQVFWMIYAIPSDEIYQPNGTFWWTNLFLLLFDSRLRELRASLGCGPRCGIKWASSRSLNSHGENKTMERFPILEILLRVIRSSNCGAGFELC